MSDDMRASALRTLGRVPIPEVVLSCGAADTALWLYARGYDPYTVKTELRGYDLNDARHFAAIVCNPNGVRQNAELEAVQAGNAEIARQGLEPTIADNAAIDFHAVFSEETRSLIRTILRHRRAGNRDAAKAVRRLLPERLEWREWTGTLTERDRRRIAEEQRRIADMEAAQAAFNAAVASGELPDPETTDLTDMIIACLEADRRRAGEQGAEGADM